jgi:hypothetical protein
MKLSTPPPHSIPLPLPLLLPFSLSVHGGCQILTLEAPLIAGKAPCMYNGYIYSKDDVRSPFVKPPWSLSPLVGFVFPAHFLPPKGKMPYDPKQAEWLKKLSSKCWHHEILCVCVCVCVDKLWLSSFILADNTCTHDYSIEVTDLVGLKG